MEAIPWEIEFWEIVHKLRKIVFYHMTRLNPGIFGFFGPSEWILNMKSSDCKASKIIFNDTKVEAIFWELNIVNVLFNFCVGDIFAVGFAQSENAISGQESQRSGNCFSLFARSKIPTKLLPDIKYISENW